MVKDFDSVDRTTLFNVLRYRSVANSLKRLIWDLHDEAEGEIDKQSMFVLGRTVRQVCVVGPTLFILVIDDVCKKALKKSLSLNHLGYADDLVLISESPAEAQESLDAFNREVQRVGMEVLLTKTEVMMVNIDDPSDIILNGVKIKEVRCFNYLGRALNVEGEVSKAVSNNCRKARIAIVKMRPALTSGSLRISTKV